MLYRYSSMKDGSVRDHYSETNGWELHLRRSLFRENERSQLDLLMGLLVDYTLNDEVDEWEWVKEKSKSFSEAENVDHLVSQGLYGADFSKTYTTKKTSSTQQRRNDCCAKTPDEDKGNLLVKARHWSQSLGITLRDDRSRDCDDRLRRSSSWNNPGQSEVDYYHNRHQHEDVAKVNHNVCLSLREWKKSRGTLVTDNGSCPTKPDDLATLSCPTSVSSTGASKHGEKVSASSTGASSKEAKTTVSFRKASKEAKKVSVKKETSHSHSHTHVYDIPENLVELIKKNIVPKVFKKPLSSSSYEDFFSYLLYAEDYSIKKLIDFSLSNVSLELQKPTLYEKPSKGKNLSQLSEKAETHDTYYVAFYLGSIPSLSPSATLFLFIWQARKSSHFREFLKRCHQAIDCAATNRSLVNFLFPNPTISSSSDMPTRNLKEKEAFAIDQVCRVMGAPAYLIEGSPSVTFGKISTTGTLIEEIVVEILRKNPSSRRVVCAPTNNICDVLMRSLRRKISLSGLNILPANAAFREIDGVPADNLSSCTNEGEGFLSFS
ncbi:hypothetical protein FRX31_007834 [Thalictrum thalictroides]|uniref:Uncharacterized protein n=1 Tax=Thalictrum thalictroides TaxID=46969 RepID=A0A7J6WYQ9_THATH|nr:hypothetical protein FRX31_007834 [Thalictrum thalictroides]